MKKPFKIVKVLLIAAVAATVVGFAVMLLWNALMPAIFALPRITYWQALGLFVLGKLLFGGFHGRRHHDGYRWGRHMRERWEQMSPEEREKLREGLRGSRCWPGHPGYRRGPWGRGDEIPEKEEVKRG
ncbi:MAG: hypothetical protein JF584_14290 [Acidobacteria bacterium]|nr:hypothetical protein [Acidobacteriota bacterium]